MDRESDRLLPGQQGQAPQQEETPPSGCCGLIHYYILKIKGTAISLYHAFGDPRTHWMTQIVVALALMLAITPFDFIPLEGPLAAIFDLIMMPLLVWLSVKLIPTQVFEEAQHKARSTSFSLVPLRNHWRLAACVYVFWTMQFITMARVLPHPLQTLHLDKASAWAASHTLLLTAIFLGFFNFKCLIVVVVTLWRQARQSREAHKALEAGGMLAQV